MITYNRQIVQQLGLIMLALFCSLVCQAQQDPQFTHYMYNTMGVNAAYAGQRDVLSATLLYRNQWVGFEGAPENLTFGIHTPLKNERIGLGLNFVGDKLGPASEVNIDANASYTIPASASGELELSFGLKAGFHHLSTYWSKGTFQNPNDPLYETPLSLGSPTVGFGAYLHSEKWYVGASVPNFLTTEHYNDIEQSIATERLNYYLIGGVVFDVSSNVKLKPAFLVKGVSGAPLIADVSINSLISEKFVLGLAYRWDDSVSGLAGFQINPSLYIGYSYDATTTAGLRTYNSGTHEIVLRFELQQLGTFITPRFF